MAWDPETSPRQLVQAIDRLDRPLVNELCEALVDYVRVEQEPHPLQSARRILEALRGQREFALMERVADALILSGRDDAVIRRYHAQALLDQGQLSAAEAMLHALVDDVEPGSDEHAEARGLLGRAYKQMYVAAAHGPLERRQGFLERSIAEYRGVYDESANRWHGINAVALLQRADRDGLVLASDPDPGAAARELAQKILTRIENLADPDKWDCGTAVEACVALERTNDALGWFDAYLRLVDAFGIASLLRQVTEVWGLDSGSEPGAHLIPVLQAELLRREGGPEVLIGPDQLGPHTAIALLAADHGYEKVLGSERFRNLRWFHTALERCSSVARIEDPNRGGLGTGFLVEGTQLADWLPAVVLVTNAHVVSDTAGLKPHRADVTFREPDRVITRHKVRLLWSSPPDDLDVSILELDGDVPQGTCCPVAGYRPLMDSEDAPRTYIIGHAGGGEDILLSLSDNKILDSDETRVHYRTPTLEGSSGSPVFNEDWELIALHHRGDKQMTRLDGNGTYPANEGIWFDRIAAALAAAPRPTD